MAFSDIKGQETALEFFRRVVNGNHLAHAYLFLGPQGLGKTFLAKNLAKFVNCENPVKKDKLSIDCCESCISCNKINDDNHPDIHWVEPVGLSRKISITQIRALQKEISLKTYEGKFKVFVILEAEGMTTEAANSLLKTLEEPPQESLIILTATSVSGLLSTIISRCHLVKFYPLKHQRLKEILKKEYGLGAESVHFLSAQAEGRLGWALRLKEEEVMHEKNRLIERACQSRMRANAADIFTIKDKEQLRVQISYLLNWFRDILIFKAGLDEDSVINIDRLERIAKEAAGYSFEELEENINKIDQADKLIKQNINPKIALEAMLEGLKKCNMK